MTLSFQTRIVLFFSTLLVGIQGVTLGAVYWVSHDNVIEQLSQNLIYAERFFDHLLTERGERAASVTSILVADFGFRTTVSKGDQKTINSALENLLYRIRGQRAFYVNLEGNVLADTAERYRDAPFVFPDALSTAEGQGKAVVFGLLDGELYEWAIVPVLAPVPIGWVAVGLVVDHGLVNHFENLSTLPIDITLAEKKQTNIHILASSLPASLQPLLSEHVFQKQSTSLKPKIVELGANMFITHVQQLPTARADQPIFAALQIDLADALQPYMVLLYAALALMIFGLMATLFGGFLIAKKISQPVRALAKASQRFMDGQLKEPLPITRNDELGRLAETFNQAGQIALQMSELQNKDRVRRELVANVSHDLRTPLTSLHGYLETMQRKAKNLPHEEEQQRFLAVALRQSEKVGRLAQEMFELAKLECDESCVQLEEFSIVDLIQDVIQKFELNARLRNIKLTAHLRHDLPLVSADISLIERVLTNLIDNALKHTPKDGEVWIECSRMQTRLWVSVSDNGVGIAAEFLPKLFDRNSPLGRQGGLNSGGLGLLIVNKILSLHDCTIQVDSKQGKGSIFRFNLAIAPAKSP